ncbi:MAG: hypothetical protein ACFCVK_15970 [Acidimicrobiales bacterium]
MTPDLMKAAVQHCYGPPEDVVAVADPQPDEVQVRVRAAGVNRADHSMTTGVPHLMRLRYGLRRPATPSAAPMWQPSSTRSAPR